MVNLNTASKEELMTLRGIGESRAEDIIHYREAFGVYSGDGGVDEIEDAGSRYSCPEALLWGMEMGFPAGRSFT